MISISPWGHLRAAQTIAGAAVLALFVAGGVQAQTGNSTNWHANGGQQQTSPSDLETPVKQVSDPGTITTRQGITPAGAQSVFETRVYGITFGTSSPLSVLK